MQHTEPSHAQGPVTGLTIHESTAFIAAPLATMSLAQPGAEVIGFDAPEGGLDHRRWPLADSGASLYWSMLNRGKASVALDMRLPANRDRAAEARAGRNHRDRDRDRPHRSGAEPAARRCATPTMTPCPRALPRASAPIPKPRSKPPDCTRRTPHDTDIEPRRGYRNRHHGAWDPSGAGAIGGRGSGL